MNSFKQLITLIKNELIKPKRKEQDLKSGAPKLPGVAYIEWVLRGG